jgi:hypothetical protein
LIEAHRSDESIVGSALTASSLVVMPWLGWPKPAQIALAQHAIRRAV